jgi:hypothetical protein
MNVDLIKRAYKFLRIRLKDRTPIVDTGTKEESCAMSFLLKGKLSVSMMSVDHEANQKVLSWHPPIMSNSHEILCDLPANISLALSILFIDATPYCNSGLRDSNNNGKYGDLIANFVHQVDKDIEIHDQQFYRSDMVQYFLAPDDGIVNIAWAEKALEERLRAEIEWFLDDIKSELINPLLCM